MIITAGKRSFQELNNEIRGMLLSEDMIRVEDVNGQRYIGAALDKGKTIEIHGTPGNDMGAYLNGGNIEVYGNGQESCRQYHGRRLSYNTWSCRRYSRLCYARRRYFCRKTRGLKSGNSYERVSRLFACGGHRRRRRCIPRRIYGRRNTHSPRTRQFGNLPIVGPHCATGMHGGRIFIRGEVPQENISEHITAVKELDSRDTDGLQRHVHAYCEKFGKSFDEIMSVPFTKLVPTTSRPYANLYTPN